MPNMLARASVFALRSKICAMSWFHPEGKPSRGWWRDLQSPGKHQRDQNSLKKTHDYKQVSRVQPTLATKKCEENFVGCRWPLRLCLTPACHPPKKFSWRLFSRSEFQTKVTILDSREP